MANKIRWVVARTLDRSWRFCWADLVRWAMRLNDEPLRSCASAQGCIDARNQHGDCWCGKFREDA